jgi:ribosomal-protein-alanine N-acetyltransferase
MDYVIRPLTSEDESLLWEMLYQGSQTVAGGTEPAQNIVPQPELAHYVEGWGRAGDVGFVAHDKDDGKPLGAVWMRLPKIDRKTQSVEEEATAELAFAVKPAYRRHGIGAALLTQLVKANPQRSAISMRVAPNNPAVRLYERFGFKIVRESEGFVTMRREA